MSDKLHRRDFIRTGALAAGGMAVGACLMREESMAATQADTQDALTFGRGSALARTDPEFTELFDNFARIEVPDTQTLDAKTRYMAILAALLGCQGQEAFGAVLPAALENGVSPVEVKEVVYQAVPYLGMGRVLPFLGVVNAALAARGVALPLAPQGTTTPQDRREKGTRAQVDIFGENMREFWRSGPEESRHINYWLAANCFGDYYTRAGLNLKQREMITFCFLLAQGGCEAQLVAHARANMRMGNDKAFLIGVLSNCLPYIGYPRSLNALRCVNEAAAPPR